MRDRTGEQREHWGMRRAALWGVWVFVCACVCVCGDRGGEEGGDAGEEAVDVGAAAAERHDARGRGHEGVLEVRHLPQPRLGCRLTTRIAG